MRRLLLGIWLLHFAPDAFAWGLETHIFFAQWVLAALPLADRELRNACLRLPGLVLAGACLPDLALAGKVLGTPAFCRAHHWATLKRMAAAPRSDTDRALAVGYASHLVADVIAHNQFVPEHESRIARVRHVTHAIAEFAMDHHVRPGLIASPGGALAGARASAIDFAARVFPCGEALAARGIDWLTRADNTLRASPVPKLCRRTLDFFYRDPAYRFERYIDAVKRELVALEPALAGRFVDWVSLDAEGRGRDAGAERSAGQHVARIVQAKHDA
ncbi:MAG TPA: zinc dependent phospholipase C family protein [Burkholderiales bacterium]|nr:zinc dependent phospholipase C family protein [Burkholderiales bacterium]